MDTKHIYEDLRGPLGDEAARCLTRTFAEVFTELHDSVTREDFRILRESIDDNVSRLDRALTGLAEAQVRTESRVLKPKPAPRRESRSLPGPKPAPRPESRNLPKLKPAPRPESRNSPKPRLGPKWWSLVSLSRSLRCRTRSAD